MSAKTTGLVERFRQREYTGENRCTPCTAVNVGIAAVGSGLVSAAVRPLAGGAAFGLSLGIIYLRGYLVPGTPTLTKRYLPDRVLAKFDKLEDKRVGADENGISEEHGMVDDRTDAGANAEEREPEAVLADAGAVEPCAEVDDLCLAEEFREAWDDAMDSIATDGTETDDLARILDLEAQNLSVEEYDGALVARYDGRRLGQWASRAALVADLAAAELLEERYDDWDDLPVTNQSRVLSGLRVFLDECPDCGGDVTVEQETVESCCRTMDVVAVSCSACDARILEVEQE
ncbi:MULTISPECIES: hypothetical protein [Halorussus]|uniref:hypothetical protein n=1 Tax=Halorussus TaxID=1070314 RepID=UPI000E20D90B|nr:MULTISPECIES: hypothetical protein [Halorussus]NHN61239.1 hypothetical protein [Halorussus sp. JP-T4]